MRLVTSALSLFGLDEPPPSVCWPEFEWLRVAWAADIEEALLLRVTLTSHYCAPIINTIPLDFDHVPDTRVLGTASQFRRGAYMIRDSPAGAAACILLSPYPQVDAPTCSSAHARLVCALREGPAPTVLTSCFASRLRSTCGVATCFSICASGVSKKRMGRC